MKKISLFLAAATVAVFIQSCSGNKTVSTSDTTVVKTDSSTVETGSSVPVMTDTTFVAKAAVGGMAEVAFGKMAAAKGASAKVKDFGKMMVMDHEKANAELKSIVASKNIPLPAGLDAEHQAKRDSLGKLSGKDFDMAYVNAMIEGHKKMLGLLQAEAADGKDAELKAFAAKTEPVVKMHLDHIQEIHDGMK